MSEPTISYSWRIERLDAAPEEEGLANVVRWIHWRLTASDGMNTVETYGDVPIGHADPSDFVPYDELTEELTITWLQAAINGRAAEGDGEGLSVAQIHAGLAGALQAKRTPVAVPVQLPWE